MRAIYIIFFMLTLNLMVAGQFSLTGKVVDGETGSPLPGAHIILEGTFKAAVSQTDGTFRFQRLNTGQYIIKVTYMGYGSDREKVVIESDLMLEIKLLPAAIMEDEVIISATRAQLKSPTTYTTIDKKEIRKINLGRDLPYLIQYTPGTVTTSDAGNGIGYTGIRIRGTDLFRINVTLNGIPLNDSESQGVWWVDLPDLGSSVDNIQIQRGVGTSTNGPATFGASINIQSQKFNQDPYGEVSASYGSFNTRKATVKAGTGLINDRWTLDARYSAVYSDGYIDRAFSDLRSLYISGGYYGKNTLLKVTVISGNERTYQSWDGVPSSILDTNRTYNGLGAYYDLHGNLRYYDDQTDNYKQDHYQLFLAQSISDNWTFNTALHYTRGKGYYEEYRTENDFSAYGLDPVITGNDTVYSTDLIRQRWLDNHFYGFTFSFDHDNRKRFRFNLGGSGSYYDGDHYGDIIWSRYATNYDYPFRWYNNTGRKYDFNIYAKGNYQLTEKLNGYLDLQFRRIDYQVDGIDNDLRIITQAHLYNFFNPKAGLFYEFNTRNKVYLSVAIANREPNRSALVDANPERPSPVHETLYDFEAGYSFATERYAIDIAGYYMLYDNQLVLTGKINDVGDPVFENVKESYRAGIEASIGAKLLDNLDWAVNMALSRNRILNFTEYIDNWDEWPDQIENFIGTTDIAFSPEIVANSIIEYRPVDDLLLALYSKYVGSQYISNASAEKLDAYFVSDILVSYSFRPKFLKEISLQFKVNNLFNEKYESNAWIYKAWTQGETIIYDGYFPQAGINFMGGITLRI